MIWWVWKYMKNMSLTIIIKRKLQWQHGEIDNDNIYKEVLQIGESLYILFIILISMSKVPFTELDSQPNKETCTKQDIVAE